MGERAADRERGGNTLVAADEQFEAITTVSVGKRVPERGVSSSKILPGRPDECVGLKRVEIGDRTETYLFCFDWEGNVLQSHTYPGAYKCEGIGIL